MKLRKARRSRTESALLQENAHAHEQSNLDARKWSCMVKVRLAKSELVVGDLRNENRFHIEYSHMTSALGGSRCRD